MANVKGSAAAKTGWRTKKANKASADGVGCLITGGASIAAIVFVAI